jgi:hypothetical protein
MPKPDSYSEKLKDPRWQRKRLEIFQAANFICEQCGMGDMTLHAHHKRYIKGRELWDYELSDFACLCKECHEHVSAADVALKGNHKDKAVRDAVHTFKCGLGLLMSDLSPPEIPAAIEFLDGAISNISPPARYERDLHTKPLSDMLELLLNESIEARRERLKREAAE